MGFLPFALSLIINDGYDQFERFTFSNDLHVMRKHVIPYLK